MKPFKRRIINGLVAAMFAVVATAGLALAEDSITGTISEKGEFIVLDAASGSFVLEGSDIAPDMVGKRVKVTGTVAEKDNLRVLNVLSMEEVKE